MIFPKSLRQEDEAYLSFVRLKPCVCRAFGCLGLVAPHHTISKGAGGSDYRTIPVCSAHHFLAHQKGNKALEEKFTFSLQDEIIRLLSEYLYGRKDG